MEDLSIPPAPAGREQYISNNLRSMSFPTGDDPTTEAGKTITPSNTSDLIDAVHNPSNLPLHNAANAKPSRLNLADVQIISGHNIQAAEAQGDIIKGYRQAIMKAAVIGPNYDALVQAIDVARSAALRASTAAITDSTDDAINYMYTLPRTVQLRGADLFVTGSTLVEQTVGILTRAIDDTAKNTSEYVESNFISLDDAVHTVETAVAYAVRGMGLNG